MNCLNLKVMLPSWSRRTTENRFIPVRIWSSPPNYMWYVPQLVGDIIVNDERVGSSPIIPTNNTERDRMDEGTILKIAGLNRFGGSIPPLSAFNFFVLNATLVQRKNASLLN